MEVSENTLEQIANALDGLSKLIRSTISKAKENEKDLGVEKSSYQNSNNENELKSMASSPWTAKAKASNDPLAPILSRYSNMYKDEQLLEKDGDKILSKVFTKEDLNAINSIMSSETNASILKIGLTNAYKAESVAFSILKEKCPSLSGKSDEDILLDLSDKGWLTPYKGNYQYLEASKEMKDNNMIKSCWVYDADEFFSRTIAASVTDNYIEPKYGMKKPKKKLLRYYNVSALVDLINSKAA